MEGLPEEQRAVIRPFLAGPGVFEYGRVSLAEVVRQKRLASFHLYYTATPVECDCISIRESALLGALPVLSNHRVFAERPGLHLAGDPLSAADAAAAARELLVAVASGAADALREQLVREGEAAGEDGGGLFGGWAHVAAAWGRTLVP